MLPPSSPSHGWHLDLTLTGSGENSYKDAVVLIPQIARDSAAALVRHRGHRDRESGRALAAEDARIAAFFGKFLWHHGGQLLTGPSPQYPNVIFVR